MIGHPYPYLVLRSGLLPGLLAAFFAVFLASATIAQEDLRFFGRWLPGSKTAGGWPLFVEPGRIYNVNDEGEIVYEEHYEVIKDFGSQVVIKNWLVSPDMIEMGARTSPGLVILSIEDWSAEGYPPERHLYFEYCGGDVVNSFFFADDDPDKIWARIMAWSVKSNKEEDFSRFLSRFPRIPKFLDRFQNRCLFDPVEKAFRDGGGGGMIFIQKLERNQ